MIIGSFIRHYKCYRKMNFVPFVTPYNAPYLHLVIGANGSGKSSILEALDVYFNKGKFVLSNGGEKWQEALVTPVFLVDKNYTDKIWANVPHVSNLKKKDLEKIAVSISNYLWTFEPRSGAEAQNRLSEIIKTIPPRFDKDNHLLLISGTDYEGNFVTDPIKEIKQLIVDEFSEKDFKSFNTALRNSMDYLYIPVETSITDYLRVEGEGFQSLMGLDIKKKLDNTFDNPIEIEGEQNTVLSYVNQTLSEFVAETQKTIKKIESEYSFKPDYGVKQRVTAKDVRDLVIQEFFKNRQLKKNDTKIAELSSGQRKKALIDIIYALLSDATNRERETEVILAIDEPEASLHVNNCYSQFDKLQKIAGFSVQTFVTTHWYGALPILNEGTITHVQEIENEPPITKQFDCSNIYDNHEAHKVEDIEFKSVYDLASAILSSLRHGDRNWLILEGNSDKKYLSRYFSSERVNILSIGGIDRMISLVDFLSIPFGVKSERNKANNKIVFLSDNDREYVKSNSQDSEVLKFKRFTMNDGNIELIDYCEAKHGDIVGIEDVMDADMMWAALDDLASEVSDLKEALLPFEREGDFRISVFRGEYSFLKTKLSGRGKIEAYQKLSDVLNPLKTRLAIKYSDLSFENTPEWIEELNQHLK